MGITKYSRDFKVYLEVPGIAVGGLEIEYSDNYLERTLSFNAAPDLRTASYRNLPSGYFWFDQTQLPASKDKLKEILTDKTLAELKKCRHELPVEISSAMGELD